MMLELLESKNQQVLKYACGSLINLTNEDESWKQIAENDGVRLLLNIIGNEKDPVREYAAGVFVVILFFKK